MNKSKVLITGGAGFIGSRLALRLTRMGHAVRIFDSLSPQIHGEIPLGLERMSSEGIEFIRGSATNRSDWLRAVDGVDSIAHLAAETGTGQSMYEIAKYSEVNSHGTALLFDVLASTPKRFVGRVVLASSRAVYGEGTYRCGSCALGPVYPDARLAETLKAHQWNPLCPRCHEPLVAVATSEEDATRPASVYAATKYAQEDLVRICCGSLGLGYAIFRLQNVYGAGQSLNNPYTGILSIFSTRIRRGLTLPLFEDGEESRDFVHVDDVVEALTLGLLSEQPVNSVLNVGSGIQTSVGEMARLLSVSLGEEPRLAVTGEFRLGDIRHNFADISRLRERLNFTPRIDLAQGLTSFAAWVKSQPLPADRLEQANQELRDRNLMGQ